jgi:uncharacterized protein YneF (UPF0154 family)
MIRTLLLLAIILGAFGGGFYMGMKYHQQEILENPEKFFEAYKDEFRETAKKKADKVLEVLLESEN